MDVICVAGDAVGAGPVDGDGRAADAGLAGVDDAVAVVVEPDGVADGAGASVGEVDVELVLAGVEGDGRGVGGSGAVEVEGCGGEAGREVCGVDGEAVVAGGHAVEEVGAGGVGGGGEVQVVGGAEDSVPAGPGCGHFDGAEGGFAESVGGVGGVVLVPPDPVADGLGAVGGVAVVEVEVGELAPG